MEADVQPKRYFILQVQYSSFLSDCIQLSPFVAHAWEVRRVNIHENHCFKIRDTVEKALCSRGKVSFISDRWQSNLHHK